MDGKSLRAPRSRREFLRWAGLATGAAALAACATPTPQVIKETVVVKETVPVKETVVVEKEKVVQQTVVVEKEKQVEKVVTATPAPKRAVKIQMLYYEDVEGLVQSQDYMKLHPEVTIEPIPAGEGKLDSMIAAGTPPDLFPIGDVTFPKYLKEKTILNLQPLIAAEKFDLSAYFPRILQTSQAPNGDLYALGPDFGAQLLYYNKTLFDQAGVDVPTEEWTWDNVKEAAQKITKGEGANKIYGTMPHSPWFAQFPLIWQNGGEIFNEDGTKCLMDSAEAIEALSYIYEFVKQGQAPTPQQLSGMGMESGQLFAAKRAAMFPGGHWEFNAFKEATDFEWDVTVVPKRKNAVSFLHQAFWSASSKTKEPEVCWDWIKFTCGPEQSEKFCLALGGMSTLKAVAERLANNPPGTASSGVKKVWKALYRSGLVGRAPNNVYRFAEFVDNAWEPNVDKMWAGDLTPQQTGQAIATEGTKILQG